MTTSKKPSRYWRSLNEYNNTPEFEEMLHREFPEAASEFPKGVSRRRWLQIMGASLALGAVGCRFEQEEIAPFARRPQNWVPGQTKQYATVAEVAGQVRPMLVTCYDGRPIKVDGNPDHPDSGVASDTFSQGTILEMYDPDRSRGIVYQEGDRREERTREEFFSALNEVVGPLRTANGKGLAILADPSNSPTLHRLRQQLSEAMPESLWFDYAAVNEDNAMAGARLAFGRPLRMQTNLEAARVIVSIDADPPHSHSGDLRNAAGWSKGRDADHGKINRTYCVESQFSVTGMSADHRLALRSDQIGGFVAALAAEVKKRMDQPEGGSVDENLDEREKFLHAIAQDLVANRGAAICFVGRSQSPEVHALVNAINASLVDDSVPAAKRPFFYTETPFVADSTSLESIAELVEAIEAGDVDTLVVLGGNPVYAAPPDCGLRSALNPANVPNRIHLSFWENETSSFASWHVNATHSFETWGDAISRDGSWCIGQPMIEPIFAGVSPVELVTALLGEEGSALEHVQKTAHENVISPGDPRAWEQAVHDGFVAGTAASPAEIGEVTEPTGLESDAWKTRDVSRDTANGSLEVVFTTSHSVYDGRYGNNGWLQECPDPVTKVTWTNAALISPATAEALGVEQNTLVEVTTGNATITLPAYIQPGQAHGSIGVAIGYGRTRAGRVGGDEEYGIPIVGANATLLRSSDQWSSSSSGSLTSTGRPYELATTQDHHAIDELGLKEIHSRMGKLVREGTFESLQEFLSHEASHNGHSSDDESSDDHAEDDSAGDDEKSADDGHSSEDKGDDHGHGHHSWPDVFHLHFPNEDLNPGPAYTEDNKWGMSIDLNKCTGCNACLVACQSENNIPVVGEDQVRRGRELHWLRIDRYFGGTDMDNPHVVTQPVTCHHCEKAPCETVCPVAATVHSDDGLNVMVYNRCVGTRYCANNCPYKVRRFNYLNYSQAVTFVKYPWANTLSDANLELQGLMMNPEVTVRSRGVMEKCTYCVQRIQNTKIKAKNEKRPIGSNEITTACQDACPTNAIEFGDLSREDSYVHKAHANPRSYAMLEELNIIPRTKYLARVRNPHPALADREGYMHQESGH